MGPGGPGGSRSITDQPDHRRRDSGAPLPIPSLCVQRAVYMRSNVHARGGPCGSVCATMRHALSKAKCDRSATRGPGESF